MSNIYPKMERKYPRYPIDLIDVGFVYVLGSITYLLKNNFPLLFFLNSLIVLRRLYITFVYNIIITIFYRIDILRFEKNTVYYCKYY